MEDLEGASVHIKNKIISDEIGEESYRILKDIKSGTEQKGVQVRLTFTLNIK